MNTNEASNHFTNDEYAKVLLQVVNDLKKNCLNCGNFREKDGDKCALYNRTPPVRVAINGCERFEYMPF